MHTWLHIGLGSFHRAHQAFYLNQYRAKVAQDWRLVGGNIRPDAERTVQGINAQGGRYTLMTVAPNGTAQYHTITSIEHCIPFEADGKSLMEQGAAADTAIISFTVTEAGYYLRPDLHLDLEAPAVADDLAGKSLTIYGAIAGILALRKQAGAPKVTLLCCDNVRENGTKFHHALCDYLKAKGQAELIAYLEANCTCPNTMVDRITPRPAETLSADIKKATGIEDCVPVMSEEFIQWVVEDKFAAGRPALEQVGVEFVPSVMPYEDAKLRILNASHSALAFAGTLAGKNFVYECAQDAAICKIAYDYVTDNVIPCLKAKSPNGQHPLNLEQYRDVVLERFKNSFIKDTLQRITQDSLSKVNTFILPTLQDSWHLGRKADETLKVCAYYYKFLQLWHAGKVPFEYQDSTFDPQKWHELLSQDNAPELFAQCSDLFGTLSAEPSFVQALQSAIAQLN